jgi:hypothetical protein
MTEPAESAAIPIELDTVLAMENRAWRVCALDTTAHPDRLCLDLELLPVLSGPDSDLGTLPAVACGVTLSFQRPGAELGVVVVTKCQARQLHASVDAKIEHGGRVHGCDPLSATRERMERARMQEAIVIGMEVSKQALDEERGA